MSIYLDARSTDYLSARNVNATHSAATTAELNNAMERLSVSLLTGEPIDDDTVHFVIDSHNDSGEGFVKLRDYLYLEPVLGPWGTNTSRAQCFLFELKRPLDDVLAPLFANAQFAFNLAMRDGSLRAGLQNAQAHNVPPPVLALQTLAGSPNPGSTGLTDATNFAQTYIQNRLTANQPIDPAVVNAYAGFAPGSAASFFSTALQAFSTADLDQGSMLDALRQLDTPTSTAVYSQAQLGLNGDFLTLTNSTREPLNAWGSLAVKKLLSRPDKPVDTRLLAQLQESEPQHAAWVAYQLLKAQTQAAGAVPAPTLLTTLGAYHQGLLANFCKDYLNAQLASGNQLAMTVYQSLKAVDTAAAQALYDKYEQAGLLPPQEAGAGSGITAEDFARLSVQQLLVKTTNQRTDLLGDEVKGYIAKIQAQNQSIAALQELRPMLEALDKTPRPNDPQAIARINALLQNRLPGVGLFPPPGQYGSAVTDDELKTALTSIGTQITSLTTMNQKDQTDMTRAYNALNEAWQLLSQLQKALRDTLASILRNL